MAVVSSHMLSGASTRNKACCALGRPTHPPPPPALPPACCPLEGLPGVNQGLTPLHGHA
jgi:hypothetical protein